MRKRALHTAADTGVVESAIAAIRAAPRTAPTSQHAAAIAGPKMPFTLFRRDGSSAWQVRFSAGGVQIRRSLGTTDRVAAERLALQAYAEAGFTHEIA
jgi:hypothetical protein